MFASQYWQRNSRTRVQNSSAKYLALQATVVVDGDEARPRRGPLCFSENYTRIAKRVPRVSGYENAVRIKAAQTEPFPRRDDPNFYASFLLFTMANIGAWYSGTCCACQNARAHSIKILGARVRTSPFFRMRPQCLSSLAVYRYESCECELVYMA